MTTTPFGRANSSIRTPQLVLKYLSGQLLGIDDTPAQAQERLARGDYVSRIHRRLKDYIRQEHPTYQWPRRHSFYALVGALLRLGLLERTGETDPPLNGGGTERLEWLKARVFVRLTPGVQDRLEWFNPWASLLGQVPTIRPRPEPFDKLTTGSAEGPLPSPIEPELETPGPATPARPRRQRQSRAEAQEALENQRLDLIDRLQDAQTSSKPELFIDLLDNLKSFFGRSSRFFRTTMFPDAAESMVVFRSCVARLAGFSTLTGGQRQQTLGQCQAAARLVSEALSPSLVPEPEPEAERGPLPPLPSPNFRARYNIQAPPPIIAHLENLAALIPGFDDLQPEDFDDAAFAPLQQELARVAAQLREYIDQISDTAANAEERGAETRAEELQETIGFLEEAASALEDESDIQGAISSLEQVEH